MNKKVSIVIPCYGTEKYIDRCLNSIINQTYKDLEIILVNDASPNEMESILERYKNQDDRIKIITHKKNKGLFRARISGADNSTGDYICFIDSDDYVSHDYIRNLVHSIEIEKADMVFSNTILEEKNEQKIYNLFDFHIKEIKNEECIQAYFNQKGLNYRWHTIWNKLYKMDLWKKARKYYDEIKTHLIMTEDFAFSTVLFYFCTKIVFNEYANYYYCSNIESSTSLDKASYNKYQKNITDIFTSFDFVKKFMKKVKIYNKYKEDFNIWFNLYLKAWYNNIIKSELDKENKNKLLEIIYEKNPKIAKFDYKNHTNFYNATTKFNDGYEKIVEEIIKSDTISFDIFDTLIIRPFYEPKDLFKILNKKFKKLCPNNNLIFSSIREKAEKITRDTNFKYNENEEITIDKIYNYITDNYKINSKVTNELKKYEIELELKYCQQRKSGKNLFELAKFLNKRIIITSDMYLPINTIEEILHNNGYNNIDKIYLSNIENLSKATGNLYNRIKEKEKDSIILHIGDNYNSDYINAKNKEINAKRLPKATDVLWPKFYQMMSKNSYNIDTSILLSFSGIKNSLGLIANKYFDNPYRPFEETSMFNCDPAYVGYYALGMHSFAITKWIYDKVVNNYDSISFMARDGYLINKEFNVIKNYFKNEIKTSYVPISRKSLLPFSFKNKEDFIELTTYFAYDKVTSNDIYKIIGSVMKKTPNNNRNTFKTVTDFAKFISENIIPNIDEKKLQKNREIIKEYFLKFYEGKSANFDIGYSGKPENTLSQLLDKQIDTFFIHINNEEGLNYSKNVFKLNTFYDFKPKFTGLLREYILSEINGSCIKYNLSKEVTPEFENITINYYEKWVLDIIQNEALSFTKDMIKYFGDILDELNFPNYYMSLPFEYFMHASDAYDRLIFKGLLFEDSVNNYIDIEKIWSDIFVQSQTEPQISYESVTTNFYNLKVVNRNKGIKLLYYTFFDRIALKTKIKNKFGNNSIITKTLKKIYKIIKK